MQSRKELLIQAIELLGKLQDIAEEQIPDWYYSSELIKDVNDFFVEIDKRGDEELTGSTLI